jgi:hypothetical protein
MSLPPALITSLLLLAWIAIAATRFRWPLLLDLAAIVLYAVRPSMATLALVGVQAAIRYVPELSREVALVLRATTLHGWTRQLVLFLLPGLARYAARAASNPTIPFGTAPTPVAAQPGLPAEAAELPPLPLAAWLHTLNADATVPMVGVIGATRLGKTTLVLVLLRYRTGSFMITTPKARSTDGWGGFDAVRLHMDLHRRGVDWGPITRAIADVHFEMIRRNALDTIAQEQPITLVIDELTTTLAAVPALTPKVIDLWTMGASAKVFLIVIATDVNVRGWKIEGRRDVIDNLVFAKVEPGQHWSLGRIDPNDRLISPRRMDTRTLLGLAEQVDLRGRRWSGLRAGGVQTDGDAAAERMADQTGTDQTGGRVLAGAAVGDTVPVAAEPTDTASQNDDPFILPLDPTTRPSAPDRVYDDLIRAGLSRAEGAVALHRLGYGMDTNRWRDRRQALGLVRARPPKRRER